MKLSFTFTVLLKFYTLNNPLWSEVKYSGNGTFFSLRDGV